MKEKLLRLIGKIGRDAKEPKTTTRVRKQSKSQNVDGGTPHPPKKDVHEIYVIVKIHTPQLKYFIKY